MSLIDQIAQLYLREGEINAQSARERIAMEEEKRQAKHRVLRNTLKALATYGPMFIPGIGPFASAGISAGLNVADKAFLDPGVNPEVLVQQRRV